MRWIVRMPSGASREARASYVSPTAAAAAARGAALRLHGAGSGRLKDAAAPAAPASPGSLDLPAGAASAAASAEPARRLPPTAVAEAPAAPGFPAVASGPEEPLSHSSARVLPAVAPLTVDLAGGGVPEHRAWAPGAEELGGHLVAGATGGANRLTVPVEVERAGWYELWVQRLPRSFSADLFTDERPPVLLGEDLGESSGGDGPGWRRVGEALLPAGRTGIVVVARDVGYAIRAIRLAERRSAGPGDGGERIAYD